jgi:hypothetical protein
MKSRILGFAGNKQSGKTTSCNFLHGYQMRAQGVIENFAITDDGKLVVNTDMIDANGETQSGKGFLDVKRSDLEFAEWAAYSMWPYIKNYSFADPLKQICLGLFEITQNQSYGTDAQKNTKSIFRWEEMPGVITDEKLANQKSIKKLIDDEVLKYHKPGKMTAREFLQFFGTDVCRKIHEDVWKMRLIKDIEAEEPLVAVIDDCRFVNEIGAIHESGGKVIKLTRNIHKDSHSSEQDLNGFDGFDAVIDNQNLSIFETNIEIIKLLTEWGWLAAEVKKQPEKNDESKNEPQLVGGIHKFRQEED